MKFKHRFLQRGILVAMLFAVCTVSGCKDTANPEITKPIDTAETTVQKTDLANSLPGGKKEEQTGKAAFWADTRWLAFREVIQQDDGSVTDNPLLDGDHGCYELRLFADGTAQWLEFYEGEILQNPNGYWQLSAGGLIFSPTKDVSQAEEYEIRVFRQEDGEIALEWNEAVTVYFEQAPMLEKYARPSLESLFGNWTFVSGRTDGYEYTAESENIDGSLHFYSDGAEGILADYYWYNYDLVEWFGEPITIRYDQQPNSGWSEWVAVLPGDEERGVETLVYLVDENTLYYENFYYLDGAPTVSLLIYQRAGENNVLEDDASPYCEVLEDYQRLFDTGDSEGWAPPVILLDLLNVLGGNAGCEVGYAIDDISGDGIPELLIGAVSQEQGLLQDCLIYAVYTLVDESPELVLVSDYRSAFYWAVDGLAYVGSDGAAYSMFGGYHIAPDCRSLICRDFYYTYAIDGNYENIGCYYNTTGEITGDSEELLDWSLDVFESEKMRYLYCTQELYPTPFRESSEDTTGGLQIGWREDILDGKYGEWDVALLSDMLTAPRTVFIGDGHRDFTVLNLTLLDVDEDGIMYFDTEPIYEYGTLKAGLPLEVMMPFYGDIPNWGISYVDPEGTYFRFALAVSGYDGSLELIPF